jgi:hypothetical protein
MGHFHDIDPPMTSANLKQSNMAKQMSIGVKFLQALCLRLQQLPTEKKRVCDIVSNQTRLVSCASNEILQCEFMMHKTPLGDAFDAYCKKYEQSGSPDVLFELIRKTLSTTTKVGVTHFTGL